MPWLYALTAYIKDLHKKGVVFVSKMRGNSHASLLCSFTALIVDLLRIMSQSNSMW